MWQALQQLEDELTAELTGKEMPVPFGALL